jgi:general secretion pathway protein H
MRSQRGFSLIELVVVMVLIAALAGLGAAALHAGLPGQQLRAAAREVAGELRFTRAQAIATGRAQEFRLDMSDRRWTAADQRQGQLDAAVGVVATTARSEQPVQDVAVVRFFPEGAATGGRIVLSRGQAAWRVDVAWLTGEVTLQRGDGEP